MHSLLGLRCLEPSPDGEVPAPIGALVVSIDFENTSGLLSDEDVRDTSAQMGVAIFDPEKLHERGSFQTFHFASGPPDYIQQASDKYIFDTTIECSPVDFVEYLKSLWPQDRPFVLVAQSISGERSVLHRLGYTLTAQPQLKGVVDVYPMSGDVFNAGRGFGSLRKIMTEPGMDWEKGDFHCAGNDAFYTLKVALLLSVLGYRQQCSNPGP